jgi:putative peptide zinc metalloprotease protein
MVTLSDSLVSSSARRMPIRMRPDLTAKQQRYLGQSYWIVKDPVGLNYFRFQDEEYAILQMLDGRTSLDEIKERFEAEFPPQKITLEELQQFLGQLHRSGLIVAAVPGQGRELRKRRDERQRQQLLATLSNVLCIRFKGVDPERLLNWLYPKVRWLFSPVVLVLCLLLGVSALLLIAVEFEVFRSKLPGFYQFFSPSNAFLLAVSLMFTKILHELGHGLMCKHFGGECHEIGVMILVLTPCMYCNVSDSWMLPNKWQRAMIGAAGIFVEITLAAIATFFWWFTQPGLFHYLCLNVMFVSSVSTILFNANPLLRYDGYYILSDIVEIPNLRQKATTILSRKLGHWFLGLEPPDDPFLPERNQVFFALYTVAAVCYRWLILASILMFLYKVFEPYGLKVLGQLIAATAIWGLLFQPIYKLGKFFYVPGRWHKVKKWRMYCTIGGLLAIVAFFLWADLPYHIVASLETRVRDAETVFVTEPGKLEKIHVKPGDRVQAGDVLAELSSIDLELQIVELEEERAAAEQELRTLRRLGAEGSNSGYSRIEQEEKNLEAIRQKLKEMYDQRGRLELKAPRDGVVLPPPWVPKREDPTGRLSRWYGTPFEPQNAGCRLDRRDKFCLVGEPDQMEAVLVIDQADSDFVVEGQPVDIKLDQLPFQTFSGKIDNIAVEEMTVSPRRLAAKHGGEVPTETDPQTGIERPQSTSYYASVPLPDPDDLLRTGLRGRAKVHVRWQTLGERVWRLLMRTFNFTL